MAKEALGAAGDVKPVEKKGPRLRTETRSYTVDEPELTEWLTGSKEPVFYISEVWIQPSGSIEFTVTTAKQAEVPVVRRAGAQNDRRYVPEIRPDGNIERFVVTGADDGLTGPDILDDAPTGTADPTPMIAGRGETGKARLKTRRELNLEARASGRAEQPGPRITDRDGDEDDPVPSAIPR